MTKLCAVYGASRGIGRAIADKFYAEGYNVALMSRNMEQLRRTITEIEEKHLPLPRATTKPSLVPVQCDVTKPNDISSSVAALKEKFHRTSPDVLVNCAGILHVRLLVSSSTDIIQDQINTNLIGTINVCRAHLKGMLKEKSGAIICIGSTAGSVGWVGQSVYAATKSALVGFSRNLAAEVASRQITVNVIAPGFTRTDMTSSIIDNDVIKRIPLGRMAEPEEVADLVKFVAECRYMTGQVRNTGLVRPGISKGVLVVLLCGQTIALLARFYSLTTDYIPPTYIPPLVSSSVVRRSPTKLDTLVDTLHAETWLYCSTTDLTDFV